MLFTDLPFLIFFLVVLAGYRFLSGARARAWLVLSSLVFYGTWDWWFLIVLIGSTAIDYFIADQISRAKTDSSRKKILLASVTLNVGLLCAFKYWSLISMWVGNPSSSVIVPLGLSFYTFENLSYTIDVYRKRTEPARSYLDYLLFVSFFPHLIAGPILRAKEFLPQIQAHPLPEHHILRENAWRFLFGFIKKVCIADHLARFVDSYYSSPLSYSQSTAAVAQVAFVAQVYLDFSAYSDMAIAAASWLGFRLPENFNRPFMAHTLQDFWRRWHMTLSSWFRDYVYVPLLGSQPHILRRSLVLIATMGLVGLWHGARSNMLVWGLLQGCYLAIELHLIKKVDKDETFGTDWRFIVPRWIFTQGSFILAAPFFRAESLEKSQIVLKHILGFQQSTSSFTPAPSGWVSLGLIALLFFQFSNFRNWTYKKIQLQPLWAFAALWGVILALAVALSRSRGQPFVYFQF